MEGRDRGDCVPEGPNDRSDSTHLAEILAGTAWNAPKGRAHPVLSATARTATAEGTG